MKVPLGRGKGRKQLVHSQLLKEERSNNKSLIFISFTLHLCSHAGLSMLVYLCFYITFSVYASSFIFLSLHSIPYFTLSCHGFSQ